jgi:hypothetical protein
MERFRLAVAALTLVEERQVVEALKRIGMCVAEGFTSERERLLVERLRLAVAALSLVEERQVVEALKRVGMGLAEGLPA